MYFVTTANHFSKSAQDAARKVVEKNILDSFELIDYQRFVDMLNLQRENYPRKWESLLRIKDNGNIIWVYLAGIYSLVCVSKGCENDIFIVMDII